MSAGVPVIVGNEVWCPDCLKPTLVFTQTMRVEWELIPAFFNGESGHIGYFEGKPRCVYPDDNLPEDGEWPLLNCIECGWSYDLPDDYKQPFYPKAIDQ